jgi:hypothetical protein
MAHSRQWLRVGADFFDDPRWVAAAVRAQCAPGLVMGVVMGIICHAARAAELRSIDVFSTEAVVRKFGCSATTVEKIMAALAEAGIVVGATVPHGGVWDFYRSSTARNRRLRERKAPVERPQGVAVGDAQETPAGRPPLSSEAAAAFDKGSISVGIGATRVDNGKVVVGGSDAGFPRAVRGTAQQSAAAVEPVRPTRSQEVLSDAGLLDLLVGACNGNVRRLVSSGNPDQVATAIADVSPIQAAMAAGADLDFDVLPVLPEMVAVEGQPPIPKWGGWVLDEIRARQARRTGRTALAPAPVPRPQLPDQPAAVDPLPVARPRSSAPPTASAAGHGDFDMSEVVAGFISGTLAWDAKRFGPAPGQPGCRVSREALTEGGFFDVRAGDSRTGG